MVCLRSVCVRVRTSVGVIWGSGRSDQSFCDVRLLISKPPAALPSFHGGTRLPRHVFKTCLKLPEKQRSRAAKLIQRSVRTWLLAKPHSASSGGDGANAEELVELPEPPRPASTEPATAECAICWDGDPEYAVVPCGHRCLCARCTKAVSECPVCRGEMTAVLRVFV